MARRQKALTVRKPRPVESSSSASSTSQPEPHTPSTAMIDGSRIYPTESDPSVWRILDIEIILVIHMTATIMTHLALQDYFLEASCLIDLGFSNKTCVALKSLGRSGGYEKEEEKVQRFMGTLVMWRTIIQHFLPMILITQIGAWSDKHGRKLPMIMVVVTFVCRYVFLLTAVTLGMSAWDVGLISAGIASLAGNNACFGMAAFSYVSDTTPSDKLTQRTSITGSAFFFGITFGMLLGGFFSAQDFSYRQIFIIGLTMECLVLTSILIFIRDVNKEEGATTMEMITDLFNSKHFKESVQSVVKERRGNARFKLLTLLCAHSLMLAPMYGESGVEYLAGRMALNWDTATYSSFITYRTIVGFVSNFMSMAILTEVLSLSDPIIGIISCLSIISSSICYAFATTISAMYAGPLLSSLSGSMMAVSRSIIFKLIPSSESGKINSFIGTLESLVPLMIAPLYSHVYDVTLGYLPGAFYLLSAGFMVPPMMIFLVRIEKMATAELRICLFGMNGCLGASNLLHHRIPYISC